MSPCSENSQLMILEDSTTLPPIYKLTMQACNHPYMFLEGPPPDELPSAAQPPQAAAPQQNGIAAADAHTEADCSPVTHPPGVTHCQLIRASGKLVFLAHALPKLRAAGEHPCHFCLLWNTCHWVSGARPGSMPAWQPGRLEQCHSTYHVA
jgi:hypothetical protein